MLLTDYYELDTDNICCLLNDIELWSCSIVFGLGSKSDHLGESEENFINRISSVSDYKLTTKLKCTLQIELRIAWALATKANKSPIDFGLVQFWRCASSIYVYVKNIYVC